MDSGDQDSTIYPQRHKFIDVPFLICSHQMMALHCAPVHWYSVFVDCTTTHQAAM